MYGRRGGIRNVCESFRLSSAAAMCAMAMLSDFSCFTCSRATLIFRLPIYAVDLRVVIVLGNIARNLREHDVHLMALVITHILRLRGGLTRNEGGLEQERENCTQNFSVAHCGELAFWGEAPSN
jgi:hypothetical protein